MSELLPPGQTPASYEPPADWLDALLMRDADRHAGDYIADDGFTAQMLQRLPLAGALPEWRRPVVIALWAIAATGLALALPATVRDVARETLHLFVSRPISLSAIGATLLAAALAPSIAAALALRRD